MTNNKRYNDYSSYIKRLFNERVQKLSINAGFTCPNRDGKVGTGGCTFCNNQTFNPAYCNNTESITEQLENGIRFFEPKYKAQYYLAYFQAYTSTYDSLDVLIERYQEALSNPRVKGLVIGTRPDCVSDELLDYLKDLQDKGYYIALEYGVESTKNETLNFINRGHSFEDSQETIIRTAAKGLTVGAHLILGLPGEDKTDMMNHAKLISELPLTMIKLHQLQLVKGTVMEKQYQNHPELFHLYKVDEYIDLVVDFLAVLNPNIIVERFISQSPAELLTAPRWGLKNFEFVAKVEKQLKIRDVRQGMNYVHSPNTHHI